MFPCSLKPLGGPQIGPRARSDSEYKTQKKRVLNCFAPIS